MNIKKLNLLVDEIRQFLNLKEGLKDYFSIVYGSYPLQIQNRYSDLDFLLISKTEDEELKKDLISFQRRLHLNFNLSIDDEVPIENKILNTFEDLDCAVNGHGFEYVDNKLIIPEIRKTNQFLSSDKMKYRLLLNLMTVKTEFISGDVNLYADYHAKAKETIIKVVSLARNKYKYDLDSFLDYMIFSESGKSGECFLGYKNEPVIRQFLKKSFGFTLDNLSKTSSIIKKNDVYFVDKKWCFNLIDGIKEYNEK